MDGLIALSRNRFLLARIMKAIATLTSTGLNLINIPLINGKDLTGLGTTNAVNCTVTGLGQRRASKEQITAGATLTTTSLADGKLLFYIPLAGMNYKKAACFSCCMQPETSRLKGMKNRGKQLPEQINYLDDPVRSPLDAMTDGMHETPYYMQKRENRRQKPVSLPPAAIATGNSLLLKYCFHSSKSTQPVARRETEAYHPQA